MLLWSANTGTVKEPESIELEYCMFKKAYVRKLKSVQWCSCLQWRSSCLQVFQCADKRCVAQETNSLPYFCLLFSYPLVPSCFQNTALECKLSAAGAGDKSFDKSPTKSRQPRKVDLRARYWAFLFDNLRRAVDEIYVTCESDQSVVECKVRLQLLLACPAFLCFRKTNWGIRASETHYFICILCRLLNRKAEDICT